jgi:hypothetical protein
MGQMTPKISQSGPVTGSGGAVARLSTVTVETDIARAAKSGYALSVAQRVEPSPKWLDRGASEA